LPKVIDRLLTLYRTPPARAQKGRLPFGLDVLGAHKVGLKQGLRSQLLSSRLTERITAKASRLGAPIFMLHHTLPKGSPCFDAGMDTEAGLFDQLLGWIKNRFQVLSLDALAETIQSSPRRDDVCAITLDDGWWDTYEFAFPLLRKHGLSATVFVPLDYIGSKKQLWQDSLWDVYRQLGVNGVVHLRKAARERYPWWPADDRMATSAGAVLALADRPLAELDALVDWARATFGLSSGLRSPGFMTWEQVQEMHSAGIHFGSHTNSHALLTQVPLDEAREEIVSSKARLETMLGTQVTSLCYPGGMYNAELARVAEQAGYLAAVTDEPRLVVGGDLRWALPRVGVSSMTLLDGDSFSPNALELQMARAGVRARLRPRGAS
jgi:peptidoglycan/xylan/chitin deacetylase (PgdA/CDA1 family)